MPRIARSFAWVAALFGVGTLLLLSMVRPVIPSRAYLVTATQDGVPTRAELRHPLLVPGTYYVHLPDAEPHLQLNGPPRTYDVFAVAFPSKVVFIPREIYEGPFGLPYIHADQATGGVGLLQAKIENKWKVAFTAGGVQFSNSWLAITLTKAK